jgi:diadenylate cyclase
VRGGYTRCRVQPLLDTVRSLRFVDLADLVVVAVLFWIGIAWLRATRARLALVGLVILGSVYLLALQLGMPLTAWILQGFVAASVLVVVVVFQEDIRRLFEQIALLGLRRRPLADVTDAVDTVSRTLTRLANENRGALVVIPGRDPLERHLDGGVVLDAKISEPLLLSLFDPHSPGHDGAVVLAGNRVSMFAAHLPLSVDHQQLGQRGTRHAAGLGLTERCDALSIVVSEERGTISVARSGKLRTLRRPELVVSELRDFLAQLAPAEEQGGRLRRIARRWREAALAVVLATAVWAVAVPGSGDDEVERTVPVEILDLPKGYQLEAVEPPDVQVTLEGARRDLLALEEDDVAVHLNAVLVKLGRRTFTIGPDQVTHPPNLQVRAVSPASVRISLRRIAAETD